MKKYCFILTLVLLTIVQISHGQVNLHGNYSGTIAMMGYTLKMKHNGNYSYQFANWESGNGKLYSGKWKLNNDTLYLYHTSYRITKGTSGGKVSIGSEKNQIHETEIWILVNGRLCAGRNSDVDDCLEKR